MSDVLHLNWPIRLPLCHHALSSVRPWYIIGNPDNIILLRLFITHRHVAEKKQCRPNRWCLSHWQIRGYVGFEQLPP